jgi:phosphate transport system permease protein
MTDGDRLQAPPRLRHRHRKSALFAGLAGGALGLGVLVVVLLMFSTLRSSAPLASMHATASAGLALSQRAVSSGSLQAPYVGIAQVANDSPAHALGMAPGDALIGVDDTAVLDVHGVWRTVGALPDRPRTPVAWVPNLEALLGELELVPLPEQAGTFRARLAYLPADSLAARAGLQEGDLLIAANDLPLQGSQQTWQTLVLAAREQAGPVQLRVGRGGAETIVPFDVRRTGELPLQLDLGSALWHFVTALDEPRYPEHAGMSSAILGSLLVVLVTILFAFPLAIAAAVYLEEYSKRSRLTSVLQVLIANLAGIPSVVYGIIGLEVIDRTLGMGRTILAGGITLGLLILPVMILGCREALRTVPPWVRHAAYAVGATPSQVVWHQVLPYALPGMLTSMILSISRAIGEAAPLILLGAFLFVTYRPQGLNDTFTVVPIQIFTWATQPQAGFETIASVAIIVLLVILLVLNGTAIVLRNRFQLRW